MKVVLIIINRIIYNKLLTRKTVSGTLIMQNKIIYNNLGGIKMKHIKTGIKILADTMNYGSIKQKITTILLTSVGVLASVLLIDFAVTVIRFIFEVEYFAITTPFIALAILYYCQTKHPKDETRTYSNFAKHRM